MAHLSTGDVPQDAFMTMIQSYSWPEDTLLMVFTPIHAHFERYAFDEELFMETEQGRLFSPAGEFRWRRMASVIRCVFLGDNPGPETLTDYSAELTGLSATRRQFFLWGERTETEDTWLEQQTPHRFSYPIDSARFPRGRAALVVEDWCDHAGIPRFSRYHSITEVKGGN
jgi:hypothetical protein